MKEVIEALNGLQVHVSSPLNHRSACGDDSDEDEESVESSDASSFRGRGRVPAPEAEVQRLQRFQGQNDDEKPGPLVEQLVDILERGKQVLLAAAFHPDQQISFKAIKEMDDCITLYLKDIHILVLASLRSMMVQETPEMLLPVAGRLQSRTHYLFGMFRDFIQSSDGPLLRDLRFICCSNFCRSARRVLCRIGNGDSITEMMGILFEAVNDFKRLPSTEFVALARKIKQFENLIRDGLREVNEDINSKQKDEDYGLKKAVARVIVAVYCVVRAMRFILVDMKSKDDSDRQYEWSSGIEQLTARCQKCCDALIMEADEGRTLCLRRAYEDLFVTNISLLRLLASYEAIGKAVYTLADKSSTLPFATWYKQAGSSLRSAKQHFREAYNADVSSK